MAGDVLRYTLPFVVSIGMVVWLVHKVDIHQMTAEIHRGCDYWWIVLMMLLTTLSHMIRGTRWGIQLRGAGLPRVSRQVGWMSIFGAYALNLLLQNAGEVWRCVYMARREKAPLTTVIGTDIGDRGSDGAVILILLAFTMIVAHGPLDNFLSHYQIGHDVEHCFHSPGMYLVVFLVLAIIGAVLFYGRRYSDVRKIDSGLKQVWDGFRVIFTMPGRGRYLLLTLAIWACYYLQTYVCFFAFPFTRELIADPATVHGLLPGLLVFMFGSLSMAVPSNGGLGPWNLAVMFGLSLYGISDPQGAAFSFIVWGSQAASIIVMGIVAAIYITLHRHKHPQANPEGN